MDLLTNNGLIKTCVKLVLFPHFYGASQHKPQNFPEAQNVTDFQTTPKTHAGKETTHE